MGTVPFMEAVAFMSRKMEAIRSTGNSREHRKMEKGQIPKVQIGIIAAVVTTVAAIAVFLVMHFTKSEDAYRSIQIYEVKGTASIDREGIGAMEAVENLYLQSGDRIEVSGGSFMRLRLDDDKYILVEENSILSIEAEGTKEDSLTTIKLEQGAVTNEIRNPLSEKSSYEVVTPNSVMAVRGTVFRVAISSDDNGILYTKVDTFEGSVGVRRILPDGSIQEEDAHISGGSEVIIYMDEQITEYLSEAKEISYEELPVQTLSFLKGSAESGRKLVGASGKSLETLITEKKEQEGSEAEGMAEGMPESGMQEAAAEDETPENTEQLLKEELLKPTEENEVAEQTLDQNTVQISDSVQLQSVDIKEQTVTEQKQTQQTATQTTAPKKSGSSTGSGSADTEDSAETASGEKPSEEPIPDKQSYTVTFKRSDGSVFGTQTVEEGETVTVPTLQPEAAGSWDFDFAQEITSDTTIQWKKLAKRFKKWCLL